MDIDQIKSVGVVEIDDDNVGLDVPGVGTLVIPNASAATLAKALYAKSQRWSVARTRDFLGAADFEIDQQVSH
jgi:hypothetical protein